MAGLDLKQFMHRAQAIAYAEYLATPGHGTACMARFGQQLTPSLFKGRKPELRAVVRGLRMIFNAALVSVVRDRQARKIEERLACP